MGLVVPLGSCSNGGPKCTCISVQCQLDSCECYVHPVPHHYPINVLLIIIIIIIITIIMIIIIILILLLIIITIIIINHSCKAQFQRLSTLLYALYTHKRTHTRFHSLSDVVWLSVLFVPTLSLASFSLSSVFPLRMMHTRNVSEQAISKQRCHPSCGIPFQTM